MRDRYSRLVGLKDQIVSRSATTIVRAPPGFDKLKLLSLVVDEWPNQGAVHFFDSWDHRENPQGPANAIAEGLPGQLIVVADAQLCDVALLAKALARHGTRGTSAKVVISVDTARSMILGEMAASSEFEVIDGSSLLLTSEELHKTLSSIGRKADRDLIERLAGNWQLALRLMVAQVQKTSESYVDAASIDLLQDASVYSFAEQSLISKLSSQERSALTKTCLLEGCEREILHGLGQSEALMIALSHRLKGLIERTRERFVINPALKVCVLESAALSDPAGYQETILQLADHCSQKGHLAQAARLCALAGRNDKIAEYARHHGDLAIWLTRGFPTLKAMVDYAGEQCIEASPVLRMFECIVDLKSSRIRKAERSLAALMDDPEIVQSMPDQIEITRVTLMVYGCTFSRATDAEGLSRLIEQSSEQPNRQASWQTFLATLGCVARAQQGRFAEALELIRRARSEAGDGALPYNFLFLHLHQAGIEIAKGQIAAARTTLKCAANELAAHFADDVSAGTVIATLSAAVEFESGKLPNARGALKRSMVMEPEAEGWFDVYFTAYDILARTLVKDRKLDEVLVLLAEEADKINARDLPRVAQLVRGIAYNSWCDARLLRDAHIAHPPVFATPVLEQLQTWQEREVFSLAASHKLRLEGNIAGALELLEDATCKALSQKLVRSALRFDMLRFALLHKVGSSEAAAQLLETCLMRAHETGMVQILRDYASSAFPHYLSHLRERGVSKELLTLIPNVSPANDADGSAADRDSLSDREIAILTALARGGTDKELAREFGISDNGVRYHLRNIFRKLGVKDRLSAVLAAQGEGLLDSA